MEAANRIAPEHLELCVDDPFALLPRVANAGSVFLGRHTPEALGDYFAGPNHTLPTSGTARFSSPLSVDDFVKKTQFLYYTREALVRPPPGSRTLRSGRASTATPSPPGPARKRKESDPMSRWISQEAERLDPYTPGEQPQDQQYVKLNTNESPFPSPKVLEALSGAEIARLNLYSDPTCASLTAAIAGRCHVQPENVIAGNGSDEILAFSFRAFCGEGKPLAYADITYGFYKSQVALFGLESKVIPLREDRPFRATTIWSQPAPSSLPTPTPPPAWP